MIVHVFGNVQILDYSNSELITIDTGLVKIQTGVFKIIHIIEINKYSMLIDEMEESISTQLRNHPDYPILTSLLDQNRLYLNSLKILKSNKKRSLDFIGSAWKWLAGSPDHGDYNILVDKINNVLKNNNDQVIINKMTTDRVNEIINITNTISKFIKEDNNTKQDLINKIKYKLETIKEELINIAYAIHWSKVNVINSYILSENEIRITEKLLENEKLPYININEALEFSNIKIAANNDCLIYIVSLPTTDKEICNKLEIRAVKHSLNINKIKFNSIAQCPKQIFGIKNNCKDYNNLAICSKKDIEDISNSTCIPLLLRSKPANCTKINNEHIESIEEINSDVIFLNSYEGNININNETMILNGTFLIKHFNETIELNNKKYFSKVTTASKPLPAIFQKTINPDKLEEILSLKMLKALHINGTKNIELLQTKNNVFFSINISCFIIMLCLILIFILKKHKSKSTIVINNETKPEPASRSHKVNIENLVPTWVKMDTSEDARN